jgi:hypothetical protein
MLAGSDSDDIREGGSKIKKCPLMPRWPPSVSPLDAAGPHDLARSA